MYMPVIGSYACVCACVHEVRLFIDVRLSRYEISEQAKIDVNAIEAYVVVCGCM